MTEIENMAEIENMTYTEALKRLEETVRQMQSPDCDIDRLAEYTTEALRLLRHCKDKLRKTDEEVARCLEQLAPTATP